MSEKKRRETDSLKILGILKLEVLIVTLLSLPRKGSNDGLRIRTSFVTHLIDLSHNESD